MGNLLMYRKRPLLDFVTEGAFNGKFIYGATSVTGWRNCQDDRYKCIPNYLGKYSFFAVYDGHGGHQISEYLQKLFHEELADFINEEPDLELVLQMSFLSFDNNLRNISKEQLYDVVDNDEFELPGRNKFIKHISDMCAPGVAGPSQEELPPDDEPLKCAIRSETLKFLLDDQLEKDESDEDDIDYDVGNEAGSENSESEDSDMDDAQAVQESEDEIENNDKLSKENKDKSNGENDVIEEIDEVPEIGYKNGSTATVVLVSPDYIYVANVGDSRCVISIKSKAFEASVDHKPTDASEAERIALCGSKVTDDERINGNLNMSRAFGDFCLKNKKTSEIEQAVICDPYVMRIAISHEVEFVVIASDGIWNAMTSQEVVDYIMIRLQSEDFTVEDICEELCQFAIAPNTSGDGTGCDNMTVIIILLNVKKQIIIQNQPDTNLSINQNEKENNISDLASNMEFASGSSGFRNSETSSAANTTTSFAALEKERLIQEILSNSLFPMQSQHTSNRNFSQEVGCINLGDNNVPGENTGENIQPYNGYRIPDLDEALHHYNLYEQALNRIIHSSLLTQVEHNSLIQMLLKYVFTPLPGFCRNYANRANLITKCCAHRCVGDPVLVHSEVDLMTNIASRINSGHEPTSDAAYALKPHQPPKHPASSAKKLCMYRDNQRGKHQKIKTDTKSNSDIVIVDLCDDSESEVSVDQNGQNITKVSVSCVLPIAKCNVDEKKSNTDQEISKDDPPTADENAKQNQIESTEKFLRKMKYAEENEDIQTASTSGGSCAFNNIAEECVDGDMEDCPVEKIPDAEIMEINQSIDFELSTKNDSHSDVEKSKHGDDL